MSEDAKIKPRNPAWMVWTAASTCLVSGIMCNIAVKIMNRQVVPICDGCEAEPFNQPFWQTFIMFCGEAFCLFTFFGDRWLSRKHGKEHGYLEFPVGNDLVRRQCPWWWWALPALIDLLGTVLVNMAFAITFASTVQMLRNSILIMTSLLTIVLMRRPLRVHEWLGILIMTVGMVVSGIQAIISPDASSVVDDDKAWLGVLFTLCGTVFNAFQLIIEEKMMAKAYTPPMLGVGTQGMLGIAMNLFALGVAHWAGFYDLQAGWYQMNNDGLVILGNVWYLIVVWIFNGAGLCTTALGSGLLRGVIYSCRSPILFVIEIIVKWQDFNWLGLCGLVLAAIGFVFYGFIFPGLKEGKAKRVLKKKVCGKKCTGKGKEEEEEENAIGDQEKVATSQV